MSVDKEHEPEYASKFDIRYLERRMDSAMEERAKIKKMIKLILATMVDKKMIGENTAKAFAESKEIVNPTLVQFFMDTTYEEAKLWIAAMKMKKGALRSQLGIKEGEKIPPSILHTIARAKVGTKVSFRGKSITVTAKLKKRVQLAIRFRKMRKK